MTKDLMKAKNALQELAESLQVDAKELEKTLKDTVCKPIKTSDGGTRSLTDSEFLTFVIIANKYKLNPLLNELYAFPSKRGGIIPIVPIDGWVSLVNRQPKHDGVELIENEDEKGELRSVTSKFYIKGMSHPIVITEYMDECFRKDSPAWKWKRRMLRHKGYIQGARYAHGFSGLSDPDEGERRLEAEEVENKKLSSAKAEVDMPEEIETVQETEQVHDETQPDQDPAEKNTGEILSVEEALQIAPDNKINIEGSFMEMKPRTAKNHKLYD
ncbi:hypothetical protein LCGC14_2131200, partial [marine sediment metagenome]